jgi:hypothetical protein
MLNWAAHVRRLQTPMLVVALDDETAALCAQHNIPYMVASDVKQMLAGASFRKDRAGKFRTFGSVSATGVPGMTPRSCSHRHLGL